MYDVYGALLKDYIYMGDRLIAEYDHVGSRFLYYTPDQINSTRVVTDQGGNVVYSVVHDPYGGIQQTSPGNSYDPQLKFSGKERDVESDLDYFGARYCDHTLYRFLSVDPVISARAAWYDPQGSNLYGYCRGNPIRFLDPDGKQTIEIWRSRYGTDATYGIYNVRLGQRVITGYTLEPARGVGKGPIPIGTYDAKEYWWPKHGYQVFWLQDVEGFKGVFIHSGATSDDTTGCPLFGKGRYSGGITGSKRAMDELVYEIAKFRADRIEESIGGFFFDLDYLNFQLQTQVAIYDLPAGTVTYTWELSQIK